ncbi:sodium/calcium exchanger regulatory protein 1-like [Pollicipes pollicipes]|uniref:sodium/calcium exchanger regulatory protein 1-like n=1 Tax=Pollicipes pollicipes TaxID=41117 RepID=UPI001884C2BA|nr:sodium/calcium exchanger regulatory protein 1-like [Pollicipes pollicipes]
MVDYNGSYTLVSSDNFDEFLKAMGASAVMRTAAQVGKPTIHVSVSGDHWKLRQTTKLSSTSMEFDVGVPRHLSAPGGASVTSVITKERDRLIEKRTGADKNPETVREFTGSQLKVTLKVDDVVCVRVFQKQ